jgi:hypothetical protein
VQAVQDIVRQAERERLARAAAAAAGGGRHHSEL